jgi:flagellar biosynthesis protein FlhG
MPENGVRLEVEALATTGVGARDRDQASGLRRLVQAQGPRWTLMLLAGLRNAEYGAALLAALEDLAREAGRVLVIDAARVQVGAAAGLALRYDLDHVISGDCELADACVRCSDRMWILPAGRAIDGGLVEPARARSVAEAVLTVAAGFEHVVLLLPAARAAWVRILSPVLAEGRAVVPVRGGPEASTAVLSAIRNAVSEAEIGDFHLLFLGLGEATAGRLLSGMAAIANRHFGARVTGARTLAGTVFGAVRTARGRPVGITSESGS